MKINRFKRLLKKNLLVSRDREKYRMLEIVNAGKCQFPLLSTSNKISLHSQKLEKWFTPQAMESLHPKLSNKWSNVVVRCLVRSQ